MTAIIDNGSNHRYWRQSQGMIAIIDEQSGEMTAIINDESNRRDDRKSQGMAAIIGGGSTIIGDGSNHRRWTAIVDTSDNNRR
jgi:hypothetical protein